MTSIKKLIKKCTLKGKVINLEKIFENHTIDTKIRVLWTGWQAINIENRR